MNIHEFTTSVNAAQPPGHLPVHLEAMWYAKKGNWEKAHNLVQDLPDRDAAHIHAYLHRVEGDQFNADYWYRKAGTKRPDQPLSAEWEAITTTLLAKQV